MTTPCMSYDWALHSTGNTTVSMILLQLKGKSYVIMTQKKTANNWMVVMAQACDICDISTEEAQIGGLQVQGQPSPLTCSRPARPTQ